MALKSPIRSSLRASLVHLVLICMLPFVILTVYSAEENKRAWVEQTGNDMEAMAATAAHELQTYSETAQSLLSALAESHSVRGKNSAVCNATFGELLKNYPYYTVIAAGDARGNAFACAPLIDPLPTMADRAYFKRAMTTGKFAVGDFQVSRVTGFPSINFAYPFCDQSGALCGVVMCGLNLHTISTTLVQAPLPESSTLTAIDSRGITLLRHPEPQAFVGKPFPDTDRVKTILSKRRGITEMTGLDGVARIYGFVPVDGFGQPLFILVGVPADVALAPASQLLTRDLIRLAVVIALAAVAAWIFGYILITRRVGRLAIAAKKVAAGDLTIRLHPHHQRDEIDRLALDFNAMTRELQKNRDHLEDIVKQRTAQLEEANKEMEAFTYSVSHDLRAPLRAIDGFSRILLEDYADKLDSEGKRLFGVVRDNTVKMGRLIDDLLTLSRVGRHEMTRTAVDMTLLAREVTDELKEANSGRSLEFTVDTLPPVYGDRALLRQVLVNLLDNAVKYSNPGTTVTIETKARGEEVFISVADQGVGIPEEELP
ncbi:MAG: cache domain-containing protein, partial [Chloroflexota bacterium]